MLPIIGGRRSPPRLGDGRDSNLPLPLDLIKTEISSVSSILAKFAVPDTINITDPTNGILVRQEIQDAIDGTPVGGMVVLPAFHMNIEGVINCPDGIHIRGQHRDITSLRQRDASPTGGAFERPIFEVTCNRQLPFIFSGIELHGIGVYELDDYAGLAAGNTTQGPVQDIGILILGGCDDVQIFDNRFTKFSRAGIEFNGRAGLLENRGLQTGVIYENEFLDIIYYPNGYGVAINGYEFPGDTSPITFGTDENLFVEDNQFGSETGLPGTRHNIASNNGSRYVFRYNTLRNNYFNAASIDSHGRASWPTSSRSYEIYKNDLRNPNPPFTNFQGTGIRGGDGVIWGNVLNDVNIAMNFKHEAHLPSPDYEAWVWDNVSNANTFIRNDDPANVTVNEVEKPGYAPFTYPHPLRGQPTFFVANAPLGDDNNDGLAADRPWETIAKVNAQIFNPGDTISFQRGDTFGDVTLTADQAGTSVLPVLYNAYGNVLLAKPKLGGVNTARIFVVDAEWVAVQDLHFTGSNNLVATKGLVTINGNNFSWKDCDYTGNDIGDGLLDGIWWAAKDVVFDGGILTDGPSSLIKIATSNGNDSGGLIKNCTFNTNEQVNTNGDMIGGSPNHVGTIIIEDCIFDNLENARGEQCIDFKGSGTWTVDRCTFVSANEGALLIGQSGSGGGASVATISDCTFKTQGGGGRIVTIGAANYNTNVATFHRCDFIDVDGTQEMIRLGDTPGDASTATFNACSFHVRASTTAPNIFRLAESDWVFNNCTFVKRNGTGKIFSGDGGYTGTVTLHNCILDGDEIRLIDFVNSGATLIETDTVYEKNNVPAIDWFEFGDLNLGEADITMTAPVDDPNSTGGDPDFNSEDDLAANYLLPNAGSPALDRGDPAFAPLTDLRGVAYDLITPNAGCRAGVA